MKIKFSLIPFIPITIAMVILKVLGIFATDNQGQLFGLDNIGIAYAVIIMALAIFLLTVIINIFDRKTAPVYSVQKNIPAAVFSGMSAIIIAIHSLFNLVNADRTTNYYLMTLIAAFVAVPAAVGLVMMCKIHFVGKTTVSVVSLFYVFPALWCCINLVGVFLETTKYSVLATDMSQLFCYGFLTLFFFSHSMILSRIKGKNPVKGCYIYGLPAAAISLAYGIYSVCMSVSTSDFNLKYMLLGTQFTFLSLYIVSFIVELAFNTLTKEQVEILDGMPITIEEIKPSKVSGSEFSTDDVVYGTNVDDNENVSEEYFSTTVADELNDFVMTFSTDDELVGSRRRSTKKNFSAFADIYTSEGPNILDNTPALKASESPQTPVTSKNYQPKSEEKSFAEAELEAEKSQVKVENKAVKTSAPEISRKPMPQKPKTEKSYPNEIELLLQELDSKK